MIVWEEGGEASAKAMRRLVLRERPISFLGVSVQQAFGGTQCTLAGSLKKKELRQGLQCICLLLNALSWFVLKKSRFNYRFGEQNTFRSNSSMATVHLRTLPHPKPLVGRVQGFEIGPDRNRKHALFNLAFWWQHRWAHPFCLRALRIERFVYAPAPRARSAHQRASRCSTLSWAAARTALADSKGPDESLDCSAIP